MPGLKEAGNSSKKKRKADDASLIDKRPVKQGKRPQKVSTKDAGLDIDAGINTDYAHMSPDLIADHLAQRTVRFEPDLSLVELEERRLPVAAIRNTTSFEPARTLEQLPAFLREFSEPKRKPSDLRVGEDERAMPNATPHTLVLTGAGLRAAEVTRTLRQFQSKQAVVAKLFAKHIKLDEAKQFVASTRIGIGVGTPRRIADLLEAGVLKAQRLERILVDASHVDQKKRGILDMKELQPALLDLLNRPELKTRYGFDPGQVELIFF